VKNREESEVSWSLLMLHCAEDKKIAQLAFSALLTLKCFQQDNQK